MRLHIHVHVHVDDLAANVAFYSKLFAAEPARVEANYAKWMPDDPGFQMDDAAELVELTKRAERHPSELNRFHRVTP